MQYLIKDLEKYWINKNLVYEALKNELPFSKEFIKNKRFFNDDDLAIFKYYKEHGKEKTFEKYSIQTNKNSFQTVSNRFDTPLPQTTQKPDSEDLKTVLKQFEELKRELAQKDKIITVKEEQAQKYALLKIEEKNEKEAWISKYEQVNQEKAQWMQKFYSLKTYLIVFIVLFCLVGLGLLAVLFWGLGAK